MYILLMIISSGTFYFEMTLDQYNTLPLCKKNRLEYIELAKTEFPEGSINFYCNKEIK